MTSMHLFHRFRPWRLFLVALLALSGCATERAPIPTVSHVDLNRYMGDWYVVACIPTFIEKKAYNAVESYRLETDGTVATTFRFRQGSFAGPQKTWHFRGYVTPDSGNAVWGMQMIWPFRAEYRIAYLDPDYQEVIIARNRRDYVWIMARTPHLPDSEYRRLVAMIAHLGYDTGALRQVPQQWPEAKQR